MPTAAAATGFIGRVGLANPNATSYTSIAKRGQTLELLNKALNGSHGSRRLRATVLALTGAAVGGASKAYSNSRIRHTTDSSTSRVGRLGGGGLRTVETVTYQTGVTVAGDLTTVDTQIAAKHKPSSYPTELSGAGGGGRIGKL
jgi:hypothetical protein